VYTDSSHLVTIFAPQTDILRRERKPVAEKPLLAQHYISADSSLNSCPVPLIRSNQDCIV
jgi:hypothetical protein